MTIKQLNEKEKRRITRFQNAYIGIVKKARRTGNKNRMESDIEKLAGEMTRSALKLGLQWLKSD